MQLCCDCFDKVMDQILPMFPEPPMEEYDPWVPETAEGKKLY